MSGNGEKKSGGTRNYAKQPGTLNKRRSEFDKLMGTGDYDKKNSFFDKSGGFVVVHNDHMLKDGEKEAAEKLARKGYKVYLDSEHSTISYDSKKDGRIYHSPMDIKTIGEAGKWSIKRELERAAKQGAETAVLLQRTKAMTREYVDDQLTKFKTYSPQKARDKLKYVIVVGISGNVHRHKI